MLGVRAQGVKGEPPLGVARPSTLVEEVLDVIGGFKVSAPLVAAGMGGNEVVLVVEAEALAKDLESEALGGVDRWHGVAVGVQSDAAAVGDPREPGDGGVCGDIGQGAQGGLFDGEVFAGDLVGFPVDACVGDGAQPLARGRVHGKQTGRDFQSGKEVFLHVADEVFHAPFFVGFAHVAGADLEAVMGGKVEIARGEGGLLSERMQEHAGLEVVDKDCGGSAAKKLERVVVAGQKVLQTFPAGELDIGHARVAEHHHEKGERPACVSYLDHARAAPVHLRGFSKREGQAQERRVTHRVIIALKASSLLARFVRLAPVRFWNVSTLAYLATVSGLRSNSPAICLKVSFLSWWKARILQ